MNKRIILTGASGFIGVNLFRYLKEFSPIGLTRKDVTSEQFYQCDLKSKDQLNKFIKRVKPDVVYHFAALTNPQINEETPEEAILSNLDITKNLIDVLDTKHTHLIFLSTDKVFDGKEDNPSELSIAHPLWLYGKLKLECERLIQDEMLKYHIIRLPNVHADGEKCSSSFIDYALIKIRSGNQVNAFKNVKRCYVKIGELVFFLKELIDDTHFGLYNAGSELMSYYQRIEMICKEKDIDIIGKFNPVDGEAKPLVQGLNTMKLEKTFKLKFS